MVNGQLDPTHVAELKSQLRGGLLLPDDDGYDGARRIWNAMIDRRPGMILQCAGVADVIRGVNFARDHGLAVAVRGGGHNVAGNAISQGGLTLDLSGMKSVRVDAAKRTARAEPGTLWRDFDHETQAFGLATTGGLISSTGIAGLTLGGGIGWLMGKHGLSCDNLISVDIVTADGQLRTANADENADLYWGVRGGGGNFGVVVSFEYRLHPVGMVLGGLIAHPLPAARDAAAFYRDFCKTTPDELTTVAVFTTLPDGNKAFAIALCYNGPLDEGEAVIRPLKEFGPPAMVQVGPMPYTVLQQMLDAGFSSGFQNYWKSEFLSGLDDGLIDALADAYGQVPSPHSAIVIEQMGGAARRVSAGETAFTQRDAPFNLLLLGTWPDAAQNDANVQWVRAIWEAAQPYSSGGVYVNYLGQEADEGVARIRAAYGAVTYDRLAALKAKYDPENRFSFNQSIRPAVSA